MNRFIIDPDKEWVLTVQKEGDPAVFALLIEKYQDMVYNYCYRFLGNEDDAADCTQEIFIRIYEKIRTFRFGSRFSTWLYRIMVNSCKNTVVSGSYKKARNTASINEHSVSDSKINGSNPESTLMNRELSEYIGRAIGKLDENHRTVLVLKDIDGRSYEEISDILNLKPGTVKSTLSRARLKVAKELKKYMNDDL